MNSGIEESEERRLAQAEQRLELSSEDLLSLVLHVLDSKMAEEPVAIGIEEISSIGDYLLVASAGSSRQLRTMAQALHEQAQARGLLLLNPVGYEDDFWIVMDFATVIVHLFSRDYRKKYQIEDLWKAGKSVDTAALMAERPFTIGLQN